MSVLTQLFTVDFEEQGYQITAVKQESYRLFYSVSPDGFTPDALLCTFQGTVTVLDPLPGQRCYFHLLSDEGAHYVTAARVLDIAGVDNFRELGGYVAQDGRLVRWGRFYRSARLSPLAEADTGRFEQLGVRTILDLRSSGEIGDHPDPHFAKAEHQAISAIIAMDGNEQNFDPAHLLTQSVEEMRCDEQAFMNVYRLMPFGNKAYGWMFDRLLSHKTPLLFHCTAGKDRTGIGAALILMALGIPRSTIEADYMLTNRCCRHNIDALTAKYYREGQPQFVKDYLACIGGVGLHNLAASLDEIEARYATPQAFLSTEYGLTDDKLAALRAAYLEAPQC
ncbi:MAG: tyrosine-protein phosphatase [Pygmaiobacter sp.]